ncbi:accessory factor UbiK family protein [Polymorphobacter sp. PAMC 29334]|uniref:accessory factor UbiK family protein n=1 Tax=Polymorphobacter sp. PAMC 29334 TaxID=2862331 RepID=UPI001C6740F4|nr:accessory factor UbiK family protein [Polymorphobacter sp. PAMC 29334]QYE36484.1 accessory factor UbiK family protein [Polymorphobacter sp. PAMC 29334]
MQSQNRVFEDLSKVATSAMGTMAGVGREVETMIRGRVRELVGGFDMVDRDEFEAVKAMAATARADAEALKAELAELRAAMASANPSPAAAPAGGSAPIV